MSRPTRENLADYLLLESLNQGSAPKRAVTRGGTRIPCEIPITLKSQDPGASFSNSCTIILANLGGCAVRSPGPVARGALVYVEGLRSGAPVAARVVNCISLGEHEKIWLLALALVEPGNVWGIESVPEDWVQAD